jgi:hypothetical protein
MTPLILTVFSMMSMTVRGATLISPVFIKTYEIYPIESTVITLADWYHTPAPSAGKFP